MKRTSATKSASTVKRLRAAQSKYVKASTAQTLVKASRIAPTKVYVGKQPFPKQLFNTLKYVEQRAISTAGGFAFYQYSCNSLVDPNTTGAGHQPAYFDQLIAVYDHYTVLRSRIKITPCPNSTNTSPWIFTIYVDDDTTTVSTVEQALEQNLTSKSFFMLPASEGPKSMYLSWDAAKVFGPNPQAQDSLQGTGSTSPSEQSYFTFVVQDLASTTTAFTALVEIEYDVVWDEFKTIAQS